MTLTLLPAVDVAGGQAVRLVQGAAGSETSYGDPVEAAFAWQSAGALISWAEHGEPFAAAAEQGVLAATQFHPEKSGDAGAALLANWLGAL